MSLEFQTAAQEAATPEEDKPTPITFDAGTEDERIIYAHKPHEGQFAMLMASMGRGSSDGDAIAGAINFFIGLLDDNDALYVENRLMDRKDPFSEKGATTIQQWMTELVELWSGRPTKSLSVSTRSPESDGPKSTQPTPESVSSGSPFISS